MLPHKDSRHRSTVLWRWLSFGREVSADSCHRHSAKAWWADRNVVAVTIAQKPGRHFRFSSFDACVVTSTLVEIGEVILLGFTF